MSYFFSQDLDELPDLDDEDFSSNSPQAPARTEIVKKPANLPMVQVGNPALTNSSRYDGTGTQYFKDKIVFKIFVFSITSDKRESEWPSVLAKKKKHFSSVSDPY